MKRLLSVLAAGVLGVALMAGGAPSAVAASKPAAVYVNSNTTYLIAKGKKATVKAQVITEGKVSIKSAKITVKKGKKTVAKNKSSAKLKTSTYKVTTTLKYTKNGKKKVYTSQRTQTVKVQEFKAGTELPKLLKALNKSRAKALKESGLTAAELKLKRNAKLDKLAKKYAEQTAKTDKFLTGDKAKAQAELLEAEMYQNGFDGVTWNAAWTGSPYKSFTTSALKYLSEGGDNNPLFQCGYDCTAGRQFKNIGLGSAVSKSGKIYTWVLYAVDTV